MLRFLKFCGALLSALLLSSQYVHAKTRLLNPLADAINPDAGVDSVSDSTSRKSSMLDDGYVLLASEESNGVTIDWWSQTGGDSNSTAKRSLEEIRTPKKSKRVALDIQGRKCATACAFQTDVPKADPADCPGAYNELYGRVGVFTLPPTQALSATSKTCSIWVVNHSNLDITYDYWDAGGTGQWLNWACLIQQRATVGLCMYDGIGTNVTNGVWTAVCAPRFMAG